MNLPLIIAKSAKCYDCPLMCNSKKNIVILRQKEKSDSENSCMKTRAELLAKYGTIALNVN